MKESEIEIVADLIKDSLNNTGNEKELSRIKEKVKELCSNFPIYRHKLDEVPLLHRTSK